MPPLLPSKRFGKPVKIGEIVDYLQSQGHANNMSRRLLYNAVYVALRRRTDMFEQLSDWRWKLKSET